MARRVAGDAASEGESAELAASPVESDPWVRAILEVKPVTPEQWLQDIRALMDLSRPDLAKEYLRRFSEAMPPAAALPPLYARFGSAFFLRLATREDLQPEGAAVADTMLQVVDAHRRDPERLAAIVQQLDNEDPAARRRAMVELAQVGPPVVAPLLRVLAESERADLRAGHHHAGRLRSLGRGSADRRAGGILKPVADRRGRCPGSTPGPAGGSRPVAARFPASRTRLCGRGPNRLCGASWGICPPRRKRRLG